MGKNVLKIGNFILSFLNVLLNISSREINDEKSIDLDVSRKARKNLLNSLTGLLCRTMSISNQNIG